MSSFSSIQSGSAQVVTPIGLAHHYHDLPAGTTGQIQPVGPANLPGTLRAFSLADHVHQGVHSVNFQGSGQLVGDIIVNQGLGITITNVGNTVTIASDTGLGHIYVSSNIAQGVTGGTAVVFNNVNNPVNMAFTAGTSTITVGNTGVYSFNYHVRGNPGTSNPLIFELRQNGTRQSITRFASSNQTGSLPGVTGGTEAVNGNGTLSLAAGDAITLVNVTNTSSDIVTLTTNPLNGETSINAGLTLTRLS